MHEQLTLGYGLCECGCGQPTRMAKDSRWGNTAGQPRRFVNGHQQRLLTPEWAEEDRGYETPCWIWQRAMHPNGYGAAMIARKTYNAHRAVYLRERGPIADGLVLDHLCRVRACVNPDHMEPVPNAVNVQRGDGARFSAEDVRIMRDRVAAGVSRKQVARELGTTPTYVGEIVNRKHWANA